MLLLRQTTSYAAKHEAKFIKLLMEQSEDGGKWKNATLKRELDATEKRITELGGIFKRLYEDSVSGRILIFASLNRIGNFLGSLNRK